MRRLFLAATVGAMVGTAYTGTVQATSIDPSIFAHQFPERTFGLVAHDGGAEQSVSDWAAESWITAAFFSDVDHETLSTMTGFQDDDWLRAAIIDVPDVRLAAYSPLEVEGILVGDIDADWEALDILPSSMALIDLPVPHRKFLVEDEDYAADVAQTASTQPVIYSQSGETGWAVDGLEDR